MLHQDYIVRMLVALAAAVTRCVLKEYPNKNPEAAAHMLDVAIGEAVALDGATFLSLAPESIAQIMQVTGTDARVSEYVARSLLLASAYFADANNTEMATLRRAQALAVAAAYGHNLADMDGTAEEAGKAAMVAMAQYAAQAE